MVRALRLLFAAAAVLWWVTTTPAVALELVLVEHDRCAVCIRFNRTVGREYWTTEQGHEAPLRRINITRRIPDEFFLLNVRSTPTFILIDDGHEIGRIIGFTSPAKFWARLDPLLAKVR